MKFKMRPASVEDKPLFGNEQVRREIQNFLQALSSYPDRFARNPQITFEEHCRGMVQTGKTECRRGA